MTKIEQRRKLLAEATPGPWVSTADQPKMNPYIIKAADQCVVAEAFAPTKEACTANTALIVAAVNDYAALLEGMEVLADAENALADYIPTLEARGGGMHYGRSVLARARAALAKWEGQP